jgi:fructan beta-fructosidase
VDKASGIQSQALAYSTDRGRTFTKYADNPVLDIGSGNFRDPKVFWYAPGREWIMSVALSAERKVAFYRSSDLQSWEHLSDFGPAGATGGVWECPDLFPLPVDGDKKKTKWVLLVNMSPGGIAGGSANQYFIGTLRRQAFRHRRQDVPRTDRP